MKPCFFPLQQRVSLTYCFLCRAQGSSDKSSHLIVLHVWLSPPCGLHMWRNSKSPCVKLVNALISTCSPVPRGYQWRPCRRMIDSPAQRHAFTHMIWIHSVYHTSTVRQSCCEIPQPLAPRVMTLHYEKHIEDRRSDGSMHSHGFKAKSQLIKGKMISVWNMGSKLGHGESVGGPKLMRRSIKRNGNLNSFTFTLGWLDAFMEER